MKKRKRKYSLAFFLCLMLLGQATPCLAGGEQPLVYIDSLFDQRTIGPAYLRMIEDENKAYLLENVRQLEFLPLHQFPAPNERKPASVYWIKMRLENGLEMERELWLSVLANITNGYLVRASGIVEQSQTGLMMPYRSKTVQAYKHRWANYLPIKLDKGEKATLFIRNQYPGSFPKIAEIHLIETPQNAELQHLKERQHGNFGNGFFQALLLILMLYCLFYAIYAREKFAVMMAFYCLSLGGYFLHSDGYLYQIGLTSNSLVLLNVLGLNLVNLSIFFDLIFIQHYLSLKTRLPFWNRLFSGMVYLAIATITATVAFYIWTKDFNNSLSRPSI